MSTPQIIRARLAHARMMGLLPRRGSRLPRQQQPDMVRMDYARAVTRPIAQACASLVRQRVDSKLATWVHSRDASRARHDAGEDDINDILDAISEDLFSQFTNERLRVEAAKYARRTADFQRAQLQQQFRAALGIDLQVSEPWLPARMAEWVQQNVALIKSIPSEQLSQVRDVILRGLANGDRAPDIADELQARFDVSESRAQLIANDQVGKFFGALNEERQTRLGVVRYRWRGVLDQREREEHVAREGEEFAFDDPPEDGNPGEPVNCRCYAEPVLDDLLAEE